MDFPLIIRRDFALGGKGALLVHSQEEWRDVLESGLQFPIALERSLLGYKEIELEVMIDGKGDGVVICSIGKRRSLRDSHRGFHHRRPGANY